MTSELRVNFGLRWQAQRDTAFRRVQKDRPLPNASLNDQATMTLQPATPLRNRRRPSALPPHSKSCSPKAVAILDCGGKRSATPLSDVSKKTDRSRMPFSTTKLP